MANFNEALEKVLKYEGGYVNDPDDPGGETYKGIARKMNPDWVGWPRVDYLKSLKIDLDLDSNLHDMISDFYKVNYWNKVHGDKIDKQNVAESIFDFAVNAGISTSSKLAQITVGANPDGVIGEQSVKMINSFDSELFLANFTLAKIARYINIVKKRPTSHKFFYGWIRRAMGDM